MYFLNKVYIVFYLICYIILIVLLGIPFCPLILLIKKSITKKALILKKISLANIIIALFFGSLINVIIFINIDNLFVFYKECPYNYSYNDIAEIFGINSLSNNNNISISDNMKSKCVDKKCIFLNSSLMPIIYSYLCNYDSSYDFESFMTQIFKGIFSKSKKEDNETLINCYIFKPSYLNDDGIIKNTITSSEHYSLIKAFYNICSSENNFYYCKRYEKPKEFEFDKKSSCPSFYDNIVFLFFGIILFLFDLIYSFVLFLYQYLAFKKILILYQQSQRLQMTNSTKNSSCNGSNISGNNNNNENNNGNNIHYETIIVEQRNKKQNERNRNNNITINNKENQQKSKLSISNNYISNINDNSNVNSDRNIIIFNDIISIHDRNKKRKINKNIIKFKEVKNTQFGYEINTINNKNERFLTESFINENNNCKNKYSINT